MNETYDILTQIVTQLRNINGATGVYNYNIPASSIKTDFKPADQAGIYPSIWISFAQGGSSLQGDQATYEAPVAMEIYGYVMSETDPLGSALKMQSDIYKAIFNAWTLAGKVFEMDLGFDAGAYESIGIIIVRVSAKYQGIV